MRLPKTTFSIFAATAAALLLTMSSFGSGAAPAASPDRSSSAVRDIRSRLAQSAAEVDAPAPADGPQRVTVGIYPMTVYELDIGTSAFKAVFYLWVRWKGDVDPTATMELVNGVEDQEMTKILDQPQTLKDGSRYQIFHVRGRFFQPFTLAQYPLDTQKLQIVIEDSTHSTEELVYVADTKDTGFSNRMSIPGWHIQGWKLDAGEQVYDTEFGSDNGRADSNYSTITYSLSVSRPLSYFLWKLLLPLCIVLGANWAVLLLHRSLVDVRTALPATALLTAVFLQQSYSSTLPEIGYLVLLDKIYVLAYGLIVSTLIWVIASTARKAMPETTEHTSIARNDLVVLALQVAVFVGGTAFLLTTR